MRLDTPIHTPKIGVGCVSNFFRQLHNALRHNSMNLNFSPHFPYSYFLCHLIFGRWEIQKPSNLMPLPLILQQRLLGQRPRTRLQTRQLQLLPPPNVPWRSLQLLLPPRMAPAPLVFASSASASTPANTAAAESHANDSSLEESSESVLDNESEVHKGFFSIYLYL